MTTVENSNVAASAQNLRDIQKLIGVEFNLKDQGKTWYPCSATLTKILPDPLDGMMPELAIVAAARTSFLGTSSRLDKDKRLFQYLYKHEHVSPFEMSEIVFRLKNVQWGYMTDLLEDPRWKATLVRMDSWHDIYIKMDLNNILAYLKIVPFDEENTIQCFFRHVIEIAYPWTAELLGYKPSNIVDYSSTQEPVNRVMMKDGEGDRWIERHDCSTSDEELAEFIYNYFSDSETIEKVNSDGDEEYETIITHELAEDSTTEERIEYMFEKGDLRPLSLFSIKFLMKAPVLVLWQLVRHRSASFNLQSGRYTAFKEDDLYLPDTWRKQSESNKQGSSDEVLSDMDFNDLRDGLTIEGDSLIREFFIDITESKVNGDHADFSTMLNHYYQLGHTIYQAMLDQGAAKEQARLFLPAWASLYTAVIKFDLMFFLRFLRLRMAKDAQLEIRQYANVMYLLFSEIMPLTASIASSHAFKGS